MTSTIITTLLLTLVVIAFYYLTGGTSLYDAGKILLITGIALAAFVLSLFYRSHHRARIRIHLHLPVEERNKIVSDPYYDVFAGVAFATVITAVLGFGLVTIAAKMEGRQSSGTNVPFVGSVKSELLNLYEIAYQWQSDAYLVRLDYNFGREQDFSNRLITAFFESSSDSNSFIVVTVTTDGNYVQRPYNSSGSPNASQPIADEDWPIDSQEAVSIFARDEGVRSCLNRDQPKKLELTRVYSAENDPVVWCLRIDECTDIQQSICINAVTGEYE